MKQKKTYIAPSKSWGEIMKNMAKSKVQKEAPKETTTDHSALDNFSWGDDQEEESYCMDSVTKEALSTEPFLYTESR